MITLLIMAITILVQWGFWLGVGIWLSNPWGLGLALPIVGAQILLLSDSLKVKPTTCPVPSKIDAN
jgi:hypothetical protein